MDRKQIKHDIGRCSVCREIKPIQIHHIVPIVMGGTNDADNLLCVCRECHKDLHKGDFSELVKAGIEKSRNTQHEHLISRDELELAVLKLLIETDFHPKSWELLDIINALPVRKYLKPNSKFEELQKQLDKARKDLDELFEQRG